MRIYIYVCKECDESFEYERELRLEEMVCPICGGDLILVDIWESRKR